MCVCVCLRARVHVGVCVGVCILARFNRLLVRFSTGAQPETNIGD